MLYYSCNMLSVLTTTSAPATSAFSLVPSTLLLPLPGTNFLRTNTIELLVFQARLNPRLFSWTVPFSLPHDCAHNTEVTTFCRRYMKLFLDLDLKQCSQWCLCTVFVIRKWVGDGYQAVEHSSYTRLRCDASVPRHRPLPGSILVQQSVCDDQSPLLGHL